MTGARLCLTSTALKKEVLFRLQDQVGYVLAVDEFLSSPSAKIPRPRPSHKAGGGDLCYILFTSGTTSTTPKGVMVSHSSVISSVINGPQSNQKLRTEGQELRTLMFSNYAFDYASDFNLHRSLYH